MKQEEKHDKREVPPRELRTCKVDFPRNSPFPVKVAKAMIFS